MLGRVEITGTLKTYFPKVKLIEILKIIIMFDNVIFKKDIVTALWTLSALMPAGPTV